MTTRVVVEAKWKAVCAKGVSAASPLFCRDRTRRPTRVKTAAAMSRNRSDFVIERSVKGDQPESWGHAATSFSEQPSLREEFLQQSSAMPTSGVLKFQSRVLMSRSMLFVDETPPRAQISGIIGEAE